MVLAGCASGPRLHGEPRVETRLFFGLRIDENTTVSEEGWARFLDEVISREFPDGLTVLETRGQWREGPGAPLMREPGRLLVVLHEGGTEVDAAILRVVSEYKKRFRQSSVLRADSAAGVDFYLD
jgi:hypothetical protein